jgi:PleD family two-component response regulator
VRIRHFALVLNIPAHFDTLYGERSSTRYACMLVGRPERRCAEAREPFARRKPKIVLVDPDASSGQRILELLRPAGYDVSLAANQEDGFQSVRGGGLAVSASADAGKASNEWGL